VIYETAVICKRIGRFLVFFVQDEPMKVDMLKRVGRYFINAMGKQILSQTSKALCLS